MKYFWIIIFLSIMACENQNASNHHKSEILFCSLDSILDTSIMLSVERLELMAVEYGWTITKGRKDEDSIYVRGIHGKIILESKINVDSNIHGYANISLPNSKCNFVCYFLNGEKFGPQLTFLDEKPEKFSYTLSSFKGEMVFSYYQDEEEMEIEGHEEITPMLIVYDGTESLVMGKTFELNIYVPAPPDTRPVLEFSLDSLFEEKSIHYAHPSIRELFTPEIYPEAAGTIEIYYKYSLYDKSDSLLYREIVPLVLNVAPPMITSAK